MAKKKITAFDIDTTKDAKEISKAFAGQQITPEPEPKNIKDAEKQLGRPPTEKAARKKFTIMMYPKLSKALKLEAMQNDKSASDYIETILCEKFGIDEKDLH